MSDADVKKNLAFNFQKTIWISLLAQKQKEPAQKCEVPKNKPENDFQTFSILKAASAIAIWPILVYYIPHYDLLYLKP